MANINVRGSNEVFYRTMECAGKEIRIKQLYVGDVGCVVWDAALVLARFLENTRHFDRDFWAGKRVVELGSGTGAVGLAACVLGADVTLTDLGEFVPLISSNIELNQRVLCGTAAARKLQWGENVSEFKPPLDIILMSDVVYYEEALDALVSSILALSNKDTKIFASYEIRTTGNKAQIEATFFKLMDQHFMKDEVPYCELDETLRSEDIKVVSFRPR